MNPNRVREESEAWRRRAATGYPDLVISIPADAEPVVPMPERTPRAVRAAVARLDPAVLPRFEAEWTAATAKARDEYSILPVRHFTEKWHLWVAVRRWPELAGRLRAPGSGSRQPGGGARGVGRDRGDPERRVVRRVSASRGTVGP